MHPSPTVATPAQPNSAASAPTPTPALRRQPTVYPHGLDISVQTIGEPQLPQNYSRASTLRSSNSNIANSTQQYRISLVSSPESLSELQVSRYKYPLASAPEETKARTQLQLLQDYARRYCRWKFMRWPIIFVASVLLFFGLITYCIWLHDVSVARERYLQRRQQQQHQEQPEPAQEQEEQLDSSMAYTPAPDTTTATSSVSPATRTQHSYAVYEQPEELESGELADDGDGSLLPAHSIRFTSGHQNSFGIPVEEDARILQLLDKLLPMQQRHPTAAATTSSQTKVSPTIPPLQQLRATTAMPGTRTTAQESGCYSTTLAMCRGVLDYDLTYNTTSNVEPADYAQLLHSNCSERALEFVCVTLEPECRPQHIGVLPPCRRICKAVLEACALEIERSDVLSALFDCSLYPDSSDAQKCEDPTRRRDYCYDSEYACDDGSCIPQQWQCDNIKDCAAGEDEDSCLQCAQPQEFRCRSNEKCIAESARCDMTYDCFDGSDEDDCDEYGSGGGLAADFAIGSGSGEFDEATLNAYPRIYSYASILSPNQTDEKRYTYITAAMDAYNGSGSGLLYQIHAVNNRTSGISQEEVTNSVPGFVNFRDSKEIMMTSDTENKFKFSRQQNRTTAATDRLGGESTTAMLRAATTVSPARHKSDAGKGGTCAAHELRCISGKCIQVQQLCDRHVDCPDGADELMCVYKARVNETTMDPTTTTTTTSSTTPLTPSTLRTEKRTIRTTLRRKAKT